MDNLINILKKETETLKTQYVEKTKVWSEGYYKNTVKLCDYNESQWCKFLGIEPEIANKGYGSLEFKTFPMGFFNTPNAKIYNNLRNEAQNLKRIGLAEYIKKMILKAEAHYESSILKLAGRIEKKGLKQQNLTVVTSHVGVNIETTLSDGDKTVKAWTIIAEGEVQRPHYRYLVR
jgi:hypothetical protein